jgi:hypothetical protein
MGQPAIENATPFAFEPLVLADEELRPLFVPVVKATWSIAGPEPKIADEQVPLAPAGQFWGEPDASSYRLEPECAFVKPATDVILLGSAHAPRPGAAEVLVAFQVGPVKKGVRVVGDRAFFKSVGTPGMTKPAPFETIPLQWERAFGGWDRSHADPRKHACERRNPVGLGFRDAGGRFEDGLRAPNLEDPARPYRGWGDRPPPAGFGFVSPHWEPRAALAGTCDAAWERDRKPLLPRDFDRRFFNAAPAGQVAPGHLRGDEPVVVTGATAGRGLSFRLPGLPRPRVSFTRDGQPDAEVPLVLDTVILDAERLEVYLLWRGCAALSREPLEVRSIRAWLDGAGARPA